MIQKELSKDYEYIMKKYYQQRLEKRIDDARKQGKHSIEHFFTDRRLLEQVKLYFNRLGFETITCFESRYDRDFISLAIEF